MAGFIFYRGSSLIDGSPIIGVAIVASSNSKTGDMVQTYIMPDGVSPLDASKSGKDYAVCGNCKHRGKPTDDPAKKQAVERSCYVNLGQGPTIVYKGLQRGLYPLADDAMLERMLRGRMLRMGSWGDPAAIPMDVWKRMLKHTIGHTGYTHNVKYQPGIESLCMVSADSVTEASLAHSNDKRTFRVIPLKEYAKHGKHALMKNEILCPASKEAGSRVQCAECRLCGGDSIRGKSIAIVAHGIGARYA